MKWMLMAGERQSHQKATQEEIYGEIYRTVVKKMCVEDITDNSESLIVSRHRTETDWCRQGAEENNWQNRHECHQRRCC